MMSNNSFQHFDASFFSFISDLKANNNKAWFHEHKSRYQSNVLHPMQDFIAAMNTPLRSISKHYVADPRGNGGSMFRIYRDVRFSKDKTPYKEHVACQFRHAVGKDAHAPGYYLHLEDNKIVIGGGIWTPPSKALLNVRERIRDKPYEWQDAVESKTFIETFGDVHGDSLKRPPRGFDAEHPLIEALKRKSFFAVREAPIELALQDNFLDEVLDTFKKASPLMQFICKAVELPF